MFLKIVTVTITENRVPEIPRTIKRVRTIAMPAKRGHSSPPVSPPAPADDELNAAIGNLRIAEDNVVIAEQQRDKKQEDLFVIYKNRLDILRGIIAKGARDGLTHGQVKYALSKYCKTHNFPRNLYMPKGDFDRIFTCNQVQPPP